MKSSSVFFGFLAMAVAAAVAMPVDSYSSLERRISAKAQRKAERKAYTVGADKKTQKVDDATLKAKADKQAAFKAAAVAKKAAAAPAGKAPAPDTKAPGAAPGAANTKAGFGALAGKAFRGAAKAIKQDPSLLTGVAQIVGAARGSGTPSMAGANSEMEMGRRFISDDLEARDLVFELEERDLWADIEELD
ncbi:hypothetical protein C8J56DRAFT_1170298 [Mycena floridula]|nr:hypothetical protein C8J56DRAFT_1170298 [Mycena floridula]